MGKKIQSTKIEQDVKSLEEGLFNPTSDGSLPPIVDAIETVKDVKSFLKWFLNDYNRRIRDLEEKIESYENQAISALAMFDSLRDSVNSLGDIINKTLPEYMRRTDDNSREIVEMSKLIEEKYKTLDAKLKALEAGISAVANFDGEVQKYSPENEYEGRIVRYIKNGRETRGVIPGEPYTVVVDFEKLDYNGPVDVLFELEGPSRLTLQTTSEANKGEVYCRDAFILPEGYKLKNVKIIITNE